ncbi:MAG: L-histidine N(alpha)-methyltransferase [Calditrichaeota bacterium]|nr:MAG: L-histidine N(alpha)-methyltransferase [Calditrichota bacterium]
MRKGECIVELDTIENLTQSRLTVKISRRDKSVETFADDVLAGLSATPKTLPAKYFYDEVGSQLFEQICALPEYYLTRSESAILQTYADEIAGSVAENAVLVELGSGSSVKTRLLLEAFLRRAQQQHYIPIDISRSMLVQTARRLLQKYACLKITAYVSDYHTALAALKNKELGPKMILFLGSSIGNFDPPRQRSFLQQTHEAMNPGDRLLVGMDLMKDRSVLEPAYDDALGVTARFNCNLLTRINRELDGRFDLSGFRHRAFLNEKLGRVEMHLESIRSQSVWIGELNRAFDFAQGETIHTENSYKFTPAQIQELATENGFRLLRSWRDARNWFSLNLFTPL